MLAIVVLIAILVPAGPLDLDRSWSEAMHQLETPLLTDLALVFNWLGRALGRAIALTLGGLLLLRRRRWLAIVAFAVAESLAPLLSALLKVLVDRARPPDGLVPPSAPHSPLAMPPTPARPASRSSCSSPHPARAADGGGRSPASVLSAWPGVARTCKSTGSRTSLGALLGSGLSLFVFAIAQRHLRAATGSNSHATSCAAPLGDRSDPA
jgi:hypothetical protein